jgi:hypothetical protein
MCGADWISLGPTILFFYAQPPSSHYHVFSLVFSRLGRPWRLVGLAPSSPTEVANSMALLLVDAFEGDLARYDA